MSSVKIKGRIKDFHGYIQVMKKEHPRANSAGYVREHIIVMEEHLGRCLSKEEIVHHIDENKENNNIDNLQLMNRSTHMKEHNRRNGFKTDYSVKEIKKLYLSGLSIREVSALTGVSKTNVGHIIKKEGLSRSELSGKVHLNNPLNKDRIGSEEIELFFKMYEKGYKIGKIAKLTGHSWATVNKYIEKGIKK